MIKTKLNDAQKLAIQTRRSRYNELLVEFKRVARRQQNAFTVIASSVDLATKAQLKCNGFTVQESNSNGYNVLVISW